VKIAFVVPASELHKSPLYRFGHTVYEPANSIPGPLILGRILADAGHSVDVYEELYRNLPLNKILRADLIGISTMTSTAPRAYQLADYFRERGKKVILGGFHASVMPEEAALHADQVIVGEAEGVIADVVEGRYTDRIIYGKPVTDLDVVPFPDYSLLRTPVKIANFMTSRGCTHNCSFCSTTRMFHPRRIMSPHRVVEAIRWYRSQGFTRVNIQDDNFTADRERVKKILNLLIDNGLAFRETFFFGRIDVADDVELVELLMRTGFRIILVGMESMNETALASVNKQQSVNDVMKNAARLTAMGMKLSASVILGLDHDTKESIAEMIDFCRSIGAYSLQPPVLTPYPGTPLYDMLHENGRIITRDWQHYDMMHTVFRPVGMSPAELQNLFGWALKRFYSFGSVPRVVRQWGIKEGLKRVGLALSVRVAVGAAAVFDRKYHAFLRNSTEPNQEMNDFGGKGEMNAVVGV